MQSLKQLHKFLFGITLLVSLVSFSGIGHEQIKPVNAITELDTVKSAITSAYHLNFYKPNAQAETHYYFRFSFKQFLQTQNCIISQKEKTQNGITLQLENIFITSSLKLVSLVNTDDYYITFIG